VIFSFGYLFRSENPLRRKIDVVRLLVSLDVIPAQKDSKRLRLRRLRKTPVTLPFPPFTPPSPALPSPLPHHYTSSATAFTNNNIPSPIVTFLLWRHVVNKLIKKGKRSSRIRWCNWLFCAVMATLSTETVLLVPHPRVYFE